MGKEIWQFIIIAMTAFGAFTQSPFGAFEESPFHARNNPSRRIAQAVAVGVNNQLREYDLSKSPAVLQTKNLIGKNFPSAGASYAITGKLDDHYFIATPSTNVLIQHIKPNGDEINSASAHFTSLVGFNLHLAEVGESLVSMHGIANFQTVLNQYKLPDIVLQSSSLTSGGPSASFGVGPIGRLDDKHFITFESHGTPNDPGTTYQWRFAVYDLLFQRTSTGGITTIRNPLTGSFIGGFLPLSVHGTSDGWVAFGLNYFPQGGGRGEFRFYKSDFSLSETLINDFGSGGSTVSRGQIIAEG